MKTLNFLKFFWLLKSLFWETNSWKITNLELETHKNYLSFFFFLWNVSARNKICLIIFQPGTFKIPPRANNPEEFSLYNVDIVQLAPLPPFRKNDQNSISTYCNEKMMVYNEKYTQTLSHLQINAFPDL